MSESASETYVLEGRDGIVSCGEGWGVASSIGKKSVAMLDGEGAADGENDGEYSSLGDGMVNEAGGEQDSDNGEGGAGRES